MQECQAQKRKRREEKSRSSLCEREQVKAGAQTNLSTEERQRARRRVRILVKGIDGLAFFNVHFIKAPRAICALFVYVGFFVPERVLHFHHQLNGYSFFPCYFHHLIHIHTRTHT